MGESYLGIVLYLGTVGALPCNILFLEGPDSPCDSLAQPFFWLPALEMAGISSFQEQPSPND